MPGTPTINVLLGYPTKLGNKEFTIIDRSGPPSYSNIGTSSGTGDVLKASDLGMGGFDIVMSMGTGGYLEGYDSTGGFVVKIGTGTSGTSLVASGFTGGAALPSLVIQWFTTAAAFGAISTEVANGTDLSAKIIRIALLGE